MLSRIRTRWPYAAGDAPVVFDPTTLALTGYWRASFSGSPWMPTSSAGSSGSNGNLSESTNPPVTGTAVNGKVPASFNGTNSKLVVSTNNNTFYSSTALSGFALINAATASAPGVDYTDGQIFSDSNAENAVGFTTSGLHLAFYAGAYVDIDVACSTGAWHLLQWKLEGGNLKARVDGGSWSSSACGALSFLTPGPMSLGKGYGASSFFDGDILELGCSDVAFSDSDFDNIVSYVNQTYGLSL